MALNYFSASSTSNWNVTASWTLGAIPTGTDGNICIFTSSSPTCSVTSGSVCNNIDLSSYTRTIQFGANSLLVDGNLTLGTNMSETANANTGFQINATASIRSNGYILKNAQLTLYNSASTITLLDDWTINSTLKESHLSGAGSYIVNNNNFFLRGGFGIQANGNITGTTVINFTGTSSSSTQTIAAFGGSSYLGNMIVFNTPGTVSMSNLILNAPVGGQTISYIAGNITESGIETLDGASSLPQYNFSTSGMTWNSIQITPQCIVNCVQTLNATTLTLPNNILAGTFSFIGTGGFNVGTLTETQISNINTAISLQPSVTYSVTNNLNILTYANNNPIKIVSASPGTQSNLILSMSATQSLFNVLTIDINSSGGQTIMPFLYATSSSNTTNWLNLTNQLAQSSTIYCQ